MTDTRDNTPIWNTDMDEAPKDRTTVIVITDNGEIMGAYWDKDTPDFYKSQEGSASYDPDNCMGTWCSRVLNDGDKRMFCGHTPVAWMPVPVPLPETEEW